MEQAVTNGGQTGKNAVFVGPNKFESADTAYFFDFGLPGFTLPAWCPFFFGVFFLSRISLGIFLNMPLPLFTSIFAPFSWYASGWSFSFWAQRKFRDLTEKQGQASCFRKKSPALRVVFFVKNLAFQNPYLEKHPKRKRPMRQKDALKKCRINERHIRF